MRPLIIIGASVRAAAESAIWAGFEPYCADLFCDADLLRIVPNAIHCDFEGYPHCFVDVLKSAPESPWIYTGGLENEPELIESLSSIRELWGNGAKILAKCRDPRFLKSLLNDAGLNFPDSNFSPESNSVPKNWLRKTFRSTGGLGVSESFRSDFSLKSSDSYLQERIEGKSMSALFCAGRQLRFLGMTEQLVGEPWLNSEGFKYCGNIGPIEPSQAVRDKLTKIANVLVSGCGLKGLFGIDFILSNEVPFLLEVNPRYTASVEVIERQSGFNALSSHREVFESSSENMDTIQVEEMSGKAILYATKTTEIDPKWVDAIESFSNDLVWISDIPKFGDVIQAGWPILTVQVNGKNHDECIERMKDTVNHLLFLR